ncbi:MAG: DUF2255 family protein [Chloroflexota bacterium]|nr:DUF2255 family protein [Chloroflexota bacterium]
MGERFDDETVALIDRTDEVDLETRSPGGQSHRTTIWIMVDGGDVYVRSVRGPNGRWYRELMASGEATLRVAGRQLAVRPMLADDQPSIEACSEALRRKYTGVPGFEPMFREHTLPTTVRLVPA